MDKVKELVGAFKADELITIALEDGGTFTVQKALLRHTSPYFTSALEGGFEETQTKRLKIPGCSTETFELLLYWMCTSTIPVSFHSTDATGGSQSTYTQIQMQLIRLWAIADQLMLRKLQNMALTRLDRMLSTRVISPETVQLAIELTSVDSGIGGFALHRFYADHFNHPLMFKESQLEELGKVPGIFAAFAKKVTKDAMQGCVNDGNLSDYLYQGEL